MPAKVLKHSILVASAIGVSYLIAKTDLASYSLQISGLLIALYIGASFLARKKLINPVSRVVFDIFVFSFACALILFSTGGFTSPAFFLTYFLLFGISLLSAPTTSIVAALTFAILFVLTPRTDLWTEVLQIVSLLSIAPLSAMFGKQYLEILKSEQKVKVLKNISQDFIEEIKEQKEQVSNWTEGDFREKLVGMQKQLGNLMNDSSIDEEKRSEITNLYQQIYDLFLSGLKMKKDIGK